MGRNNTVSVNARFIGAFTNATYPAADSVIPMSQMYVIDTVSGGLAAGFYSAVDGAWVSDNSVGDASTLLGKTWATPDPIGTAIPSTGAFTTLSATDNVTLGSASTNTIQINGRIAVNQIASNSVAVISKISGQTSTGQAVYGANGSSTSNATAFTAGYRSIVTTAAAAYTTTDLMQFHAVAITKGAGSTITNQHGVLIEDVTEGTNNYGLTCRVSSGTNKWNIYASGTADNYFAGRVLINSNTSSGTGLKLQVGGATVDATNGILFGKTVTTAQSTLPYITHVSDQVPGTSNDLMLFAGGSSAGRVFVNANEFAVKTGGGSTPSGTEFFRIDANGRTGVGIVPTARNNTTLQIKDGVGFPATQVSSTDPNTLDDYREGSFTFTATGMTTSPTGTSTYVKVGNVVTLNLPSISGTSNATSFTLTGLPSIITPSSARRVTATVQDNGGNFVYGMAEISAAGAVTLYLTPGGAGFTASGTKAINISSVSYTI
jgi:hypothetical protein